MNVVKKISNLWRNLFRKRRLSLLNATDNSEEWHIHLSPVSIFSGLLAFVLLMFIIILSLMAYSPVLDFLPGYRTEADRSREKLIESIMRLDSMERVVMQMMTYNENIALIMEGRTPVVRNLVRSDSSHTERLLVMPSIEDSVLRTQMEGDGPYSLTARNAREEVRRKIELVTPVEGLITDHFDLKEGHYGIKIAAAANERIAAVAQGTVILSMWTPETGWVIELQHSGNLLSIYRNLSQSLVVQGQAIRAGEQIGYNATVTGDAEEARLFEFELWNNGKPVDPEGYIVF